MKKKNLARITVLFFVLMLCFTILSRAAYQEGTAVVTVGKPASRTITHQITAAGKIEQNQEYAVVTEPDQRVTAIYVQEGQRVAGGDLLFEIDTNYLEEQILHQQQEIEKFRLQMGDAASQMEVRRQQRANDQSRASEDYSLNTNRANAQLERAGRNLQDARKKLEEYYDADENLSFDTTVRERLEKDCEEKQNAYIQAQQDLTTLQWKIEQAVDTALREVDHRNLSADLPTFQELTSDENTELPDVEISDAEFQNTEYPGTELSNAEYPDGELSEAASSEIILDSADPGDRTQEGPGNADSFDDFSPADEGINIYSEAETGEAVRTESRAFFSQAAGDTLLSTNEAEETEEKVRNSYQTELDTARKNVRTAKTDLEAAQSALEQYQQEQLTAADVQSAETLQQLLANVKAAQDAYTDAAIAVNEASVTGNRAILTAGLAEASDSSAQINEITCAQMQHTLDKLEELREKDGKVLSPVDGLITKLSVTTGEKTSDTTAVLLADLSKGSHFAADITKEQEKYLGTGDLVTILPGGKKKALEQLPVTSVMADENEETVYHVTVLLPENDLDIGMSSTLEYTRKSQTYSICVPLSALHLDEKNRTYLLVPEEYGSIMGKEIRARKVIVSVLEQNESYAALTEGAIQASQEILLYSDKPVDDGTRIRIGK